MRLAPPDDALLARGTPFLRLLVEAADRLGGRVEMETEYGYLGRYISPDGRRRPIFGKSLGLNRDSAAAIAADKDYTARLLSGDGLPTPEGVLVFGHRYRDRMALKNSDVAGRLPGPERAVRFARDRGYPVVIKPNSGSEGHGVSICRNQGDLEDDLGTLLGREDRVRIETFVRGRDFRVLVLGGHAALAYERVGLSVTGDGVSALRRLLHDRLAELSRSHRGAKIDPADPRIRRTLELQGLTPDSIPPAGRQIALLDAANLSTGGSLRDLDTALPPAVAAMATRAADVLGLVVAGIDIRTPDLGASPPDMSIIEVNSAPGLDYYASCGPEHWQRALALVTDMLDRTA